MKHRFAPHLQALTEGPNIPLDKPIVLIGRHQECDIQIPSRKISRRHCCLAQVGDHLVVRDLGSTNGVRINGIKVVEGNLQAGDELMIGNVRYQLNLNGEKAQPDAVKNGIMQKKSHHASLANEDSAEEPMPLPDVSHMHQIPQAKPMTVAAKPDLPKVPYMEIPDNISLVPLDPS